MQNAQVEIADPAPSLSLCGLIPLGGAFHHIATASARFAAAGDTVSRLQLRCPDGTATFLLKRRLE